ncbi:hypothetical protein G8B26_00285 [Limosilactobacillus reuteri]|nr:hypothetical protein G8B26_00285 [Limosilactobacillus reuteri]
MTVNDLLPYLRENKKELIASLREGKYKPAPVKRVEIPKPKSGKGKKSNQKANFNNFIKLIEEKIIII